MLRRAVFCVMVSSLCASADDVQRQTFKNQKHTAAPYLIETSVISNKGRRNFYHRDSGVNEDTHEQNLKDLMSATNNNNDTKEPPHFHRNYHLFNDYFDSLENVNNNMNPKKLLNKIRPGSYPSNTFNEGEQTRLFFSQIFSLFDNDELRNSRKTSKDMQRDYGTTKHPEFYIKHNKHDYIDLKSNPRTSSTDKRYLFGNQPAPDYNASFESVSEKLRLHYSNSRTTTARTKEYRHDSGSFKNKNNPDGVMHKHRGTYGKRRLARGNNSRAVRQLTTDSLTIEDSSSHFHNINDLTPKSEERNKSFNSPSIRDEPLFSSTPSTSENNFTTRSESNKQTVYVNRIQSFDDITETTTDNKDSIGKKFLTLLEENTSLKNCSKTVKDIVQFSELDDFLNSHTQLIKNENSLKLNENNVSSKEVSNNEDYEIHLISAPQKKGLKVIKNDNNNEKNKSESIRKNSEKIIKEKHTDDNDLSNRDTRRSYNVSAIENTETRYMTEEDELRAASPRRELKLQRVYGRAEVVPTEKEAVRPLSARIQFDLFIQVPPQSDTGSRASDQ